MNIFSFIILVLRGSKDLVISIGFGWWIINIFWCSNIFKRKVVCNWEFGWVFLEGELVNIWIMIGNEERNLRYRNYIYMLFVW